MAPRLPTTLGDQNAPRAPRGIHGYDATSLYEAQINAAREMRRVSGKLDEKVEKANEFDYARARSHYLQSAMAVEAELAQDNDWSTYESRYQEKMEKAMGEAANIINDGTMREKFEIETGLDLAKGIYGMKGKAREKEADFGRSETDEILENNKKGYLDAIGRGDEKTATALLKNSQSLVQGAVNRNYYSMEEAGKKRRTYVDGVIEDRIFMMDDADKVKMFAPEKVEDAMGLMKPVAMKNGISPEYLYKTAHIETGGTFDPNAVNPASGATGLMQFMPGTAKQYKLDDPTDPRASINAAAQLAADNKRALSKRLGREPTDAELYLAHQQGAGGAGALLTRPNDNAVDILTDVYDGDRQLAEKAVTQNGGNFDMTGAQFAEQWTSKYDSLQVADGGEIPYYAPTGTWMDMVPARKKKEAYEAGLSGLSAQRKLEEAAIQQQTSEYLTTVLPKIQEAGGNWAVLTPEERAMGEQLGMMNRIRGYKGEDNTDMLAYLYRLSPQEFATAIDTPEVMLGLSQDTWQSFKEEQRKAAQPGGGKLARTRQQQVTDSFEALGLNPGGTGKDTKTKEANQEFARFNILLDTEIAAFRAANNNAEPDDQTLQGMIDGLLIPQAIGKAKRNGKRQEMYLHQIKIDDIPERERSAVERNLRRSGRPVSNGAIIRRWLEWNESVGRSMAEQQKFDSLINDLTTASAGE